MQRARFGTGSGRFATVNRVVTGRCYPAPMARPRPTLPVTPAMYRHFAVLTVALTALIALFADGSQEDGGVLGIRQEPISQASAAPPPPKPVLRDNRPRAAAGGWAADPAPDIDNSYVQSRVPRAPARQASQVDRFPDDPRLRADLDAGKPAAPPPGMPREVYREMTAQKQQQRRSPPRAASPEETERALEQSRQRSGHDPAAGGD